MKSTATIQRVGGVLGIVAVLVNIPAYLAGIPDFSSGSPSPADAGRFVLGNGLPLHVVVFLLFLPTLATVIRRGTDNALFSTTVLGGGIFYAALSAVGIAVEISFQATQLRFPGAALDTGLFSYAKTMAGWLFMYSGMGTVAMVVGTCLATWYARIFPRWVIAAGVLVVLGLVLRWWYPLVGAMANPAWILIVSCVMVFARPRRPDDPPRISAAGEAATTSATTPA